MKIEDEIKQYKYYSEFHKAFINIIYTANWLNSKTNALLKPFGITPQQYNVLRILRGQYPNPVTLGAIQERMLDKMSNASRLVDKLIEKKLVERAICEHNRRQVDIKINEKGMSLLKDIEEPLKTTFEKLNNLSTEEAVMINDLLDKIRE